MDSIRKVTERALFAILFFGAIVVFLLYTENIRHKQLEKMAEEFIYSMTSDGDLTEIEYYVFLDSVASVDVGVSVELSHFSYEDNPYYNRYSADEIADYYKGRNVLSDKVLPIFALNYPAQDGSAYALQDKTNAGVLSNITEDGYVPLPNEDYSGATLYTPVCPSQKVYVGEALCTVVRVIENGITFYRTADDSVVGFVGSGTYELTVDGAGTGAYISIVSYPRTITCVNGHETVLTPDSIALYESTGSYGACAYCALEPDYISASASSVTSTVGTELADLGLIFYVTYKDGHREEVQVTDRRLYSTYDPSYYGTQTVRFSYLNCETEVFTCTLKGAACQNCGAECKDKYRPDYDRFPYCFACMEDMPFFTGTTYTQTEFSSNDEIVTALMNGQVCYFKRGDYVKVKLTYMQDGIPLPFLAAKRSMPIIIGEEIRTNGSR